METTNKTILLRVKEGSYDYRLFPQNQHIPKCCVIDDETGFEEYGQTLPEKLPQKKKRTANRLTINELGPPSPLPEYGRTMVLTLTKEMSDLI